jgi:hypothetical protein
MSHTDEFLIPKEKQSELWHEHRLLCERLESACRKAPSATYEESWFKNNGKKSKVTKIVVDIVGIDDEVRLRIWTAWLYAMIRGTHYKASKAYTFKFGWMRFFITPDWEYYLGEHYLHRDQNYVVPAPKEGAK